VSTRTPAALVSLLLTMVLAACGSTGGSVAPEAALATEAPTAEPTAEPTADATPTPEPTPEPTPDAAAWGELYLAASDTYVETTCPLSALINAAPDDPAAWQEAMAGIAAAWQVLLGEMSEAEPPASVAADVETWLDEAETILDASLAIAGAPPDIDIITSIFETEFAPARDAIGAAGDAIRAGLDLPARDVTACD
jgi:hypothetical protein